MKYIILLVIIILFAHHESISQKRKILYPLSFGTSIKMKSGFNAVKPPVGRKSQLGFSTIPDLSFSAYLPYSKKNNIGALLDLSYRSYAFKTQEVNFGDVYDHSISYLSFGTNLYMEGLILGFNWGIPMSGSYGNDISTDKLNNLIEFRFGGTYKVFADQTGRLNVNLMLSYMLTGLYKNPITDDPMNSNTFIDEDSYPTNSDNPRVASLNLGFTYFFNINY